MRAVTYYLLCVRGERWMTADSSCTLGRTAGQDYQPCAVWFWFDRLTA